MGRTLNPRKRLSLRINMAIWTACAIILLVFGIFFYAFENQQHQERIEQAQVLLQTIYQHKREELANEIFAGHREALAYTLSEIRAVKGVGSAQAFDLQGRMLETAGAQRFDMLTPQMRERLAHSSFFEQVELRQRPHVAYGTPIEVIGERIGYFIVAFDLTDLVGALRLRILLFVLVFSSMLVVLSLLLHLLLTRSVIRPMSLLRNAMGEVMEGRLNQTVALRRSDEIGQIAAAFNAMSAQLRGQHERLVRSMKSRDTYAAQLEETNRQLARLNADLEKIVEERTRELRMSYEQLQAETLERIRADDQRRELEERLARSQKMEALGLLAGGVAHDLNNVLSGIVSYPEMMLMDLPPGDPLRKPVEGIQRSGQKAAAIVQDLLALARRGVTQTQVLNLNREVIEDYLDSPEFGKLRSYYPFVVFEKRLAVDLMNILGSPIHLKKTVMNLVANAAEAQPNGGRIVISTENRYMDRPLGGFEQVNEGDYVVLRVEDYGTGIAPEDLNRIFEPFYTKKVMGRSGTGLGMAVVWGTVQDHHGYINVESRVGQGTVFELYFPVTRQAAERTVTAACPEDYYGKGETVLVIDDVEEQRQIASTLLTRLNYHVIAVESGEAATAYLNDHKADILVLDMIMDPGIDGLETYRRIIRIHPGQKCIIASGYAENERVKEAQRLGAGPYIRKPYTMEKIGLALRAELDPPPRPRDTPLPCAAYKASAS
jgi:signal transduction histidine kinase/ActR/RegA family two-component response regulator/HAMP domain-containing protein